MEEQKVTRVLFVCMGNICRSPAAEGVLKHLTHQAGYTGCEIASCGIGNWHVGSVPDMRMQETAKQRGIFLTSRAQQFKFAFFDDYDYILASDREILKILYEHAKKTEHKAKIFLMTEFSLLYKGQEVPDPYYEPERAFDLVIDMLEDSCNGLLTHIRQAEK